MFRATACVLALAIVSGAVGQTRPVQWMSSPADAIKVAKRTQKPLLFFVPGQDLGDLDDQQQVVLRDAFVRDYIGDRFIGARLTRSTNNADLFTKWNAPTKYGQYMLVVTPSGDLVGQIGAEVIARKDQFIGALTGNFRKYRSALYEKELLPQFQGEKLNRNNISKALGYIKSFIITDADKMLGEFAARTDIDKGTRKRVYETLAELSTNAAVASLAKAAESDTDAQAALKKVTPAAAAQLAESALVVNGEVRVYVYEAVAAVAKVRDAKPARFWETADAEAKQAEIERVAKEIREDAGKWNERWADIR
ncbi:MAG: hypothetical protein KDA32_03925 [Phycisphaerales bacterium]|nr:hypothetical protein [Phycisphaerales bacterium]